MQDHPSSDSFYDSDFADGDATVAVGEVITDGKDEERRESQSEVDGEWGRQEKIFERCPWHHDHRYQSCKQSLLKSSTKPLIGN